MFETVCMLDCIQISASFSHAHTSLILCQPCSVSQIAIDARSLGFVWILVLLLLDTGIGIGIWLAVVVILMLSVIVLTQL